MEKAPRCKRSEHVVHLPALTVFETRKARSDHEELFLSLVTAVVSAGTVAAVRWPAWGEMLIIAVGIYILCKEVTWWRATQGGTRGPAWKQLAYLFAFPGMDARTFIFAKNHRPVLARDWAWPIGKVTTGVALVWWGSHICSTVSTFTAAWAGMVGLVLTFHFGLFHVLELIWRRAGLDARGVMDEPWRSTSVCEFWGKRWNLAYRDLTHSFLLRPLARQMPAWAAVLASFLVSGLVHEMVISVPARGGYGLPTLYFLVQGAAVLLEKNAWARRPCCLWKRRAWTWFIVVGPAAALFHPWFALRVVAPMLHAMGAL